MEFFPGLDVPVLPLMRDAAVAMAVAAVAPMMMGDAVPLAKVPMVVAVATAVADVAAWCTIRALHWHGTQHL